MKKKNRPDNAGIDQDEAGEDEIRDQKQPASRFRRPYGIDSGSGAPKREKLPEVWKGRR